MTGVIVAFPNDEVTVHPQASDWVHEPIGVGSDEVVTKLVDENGEPVGVEMPFSSYTQIQTAPDHEVEELKNMLEF